MVEDRQPDRQGALDAATVLPFVAAVLLAPPVILIFAVPVMLAGIPMILLYVFGVWAAVILSAALLARRLGAEGSIDADQESSDKRGSRS